MKTVLLLCAGLACCATSAYASGADLSVFACPGSSGASLDAGELECATGRTLAVYVTFMPAESAPDLIGVDVTLDMWVGGDLGSDASFWDFEHASITTLRDAHLRPRDICTQYIDTWQDIGGGSGSISFRSHSWGQRLKALAYRASPFPYRTNDKLFGLALLIDMSHSVEAGGSLKGCKLPAAIILNGVYPRLVSGNPTFELYSPSLFGGCLSINGGGTACYVTPARKQTWGQLKSLYR